MAFVYELELQHVFPELSLPWIRFSEWVFIQYSVWLFCVIFFFSCLAFSTTEEHAVYCMN